MTKILFSKQRPSDFPRTCAITTVNDPTPHNDKSIIKCFNCNAWCWKLLKCLITKRCSLILQWYKIVRLLVKKKTPFHFLFVSFNFLNICNISGWGCIHLLISLKLNTARIKTLSQVPDIKAFRFRYTQFYIWNLWPTCSVDFVVFGFFCIWFLFYVHILFQNNELTYLFDVSTLEAWEK